MYAEVVFLLGPRRRRLAELHRADFFFLPEPLHGSLRLLPPSAHRRAPPIEPTPSPSVHRRRHSPAAVSGEPPRWPSPKMEPPLPHLRSGTRIPKKGGLEPWSGESPPPSGEVPPSRRACAPRVELGRAGRLLAAPGPRLAWPGTLLGRARTVGRAGLLPTVGPGWVLDWKMIIFQL